MGPLACKSQVRPTRSQSIEKLTDIKADRTKAMYDSVTVKGGLQGWVNRRQPP
jgi:hypothetical protein